MFPRIPSWKMGRSRYTSLTRRGAQPRLSDVFFMCFPPGPGKRSATKNHKYRVRWQRVSKKFKLTFKIPRKMQWASTFCVLNTFHVDFTPCFTMLKPLARALALLLRTRVAMTSLPTPGSSLAITPISVRTYLGVIGLSVRFLCTRYDDA